MSDSPPTDSRVARYLPGAVVLVLVVLIVVFMFRPKVRLGELTGEVMGTTYSVKIVTEGFTFGPSDQEALDKEIRNCLDDVDTRMSTYQARSELSRFNLQPADKPFQFSDETFHVMKRAMEVSELTGGGVRHYCRADRERIRVWAGDQAGRAALRCEAGRPEAAGGLPAGRTGPGHADRDQEKGRRLLRPVGHRQGVRRGPGGCVARPARYSPLHDRGRRRGERSRPSTPKANPGASPLRSPRTRGGRSTARLG